MELKKFFNLEFKIYEFLITSFQQISINLQNITALWAKDVNIKNLLNNQI